MKDVMIRILATQSGDDPREQTELAEFSTEGKLDCLDGVGTLTYPESELTGMEGTVTTIAFTPEGAVLTRQGSVTVSRMGTPEAMRLRKSAVMGLSTSTTYSFS